MEKRMENCKDGKKTDGFMDDTGCRSKNMGI